jgi:hypothetical protein
MLLSRPHHKTHHHRHIPLTLFSPDCTYSSQQEGSGIKRQPCKETICLLVVVVRVSV